MVNGFFTRRRKLKRKQKVEAGLLRLSKDVTRADIEFPAIKKELKLRKKVRAFKKAKKRLREERFPTKKRRVGESISKELSRLRKAKRKKPFSLIGLPRRQRIKRRR